MKIHYIYTLDETDYIINVKIMNCVFEMLAQAEIVFPNFLKLVGLIYKTFQVFHTLLYHVKNPCKNNLHK